VQETIYKASGSIGRLKDPNHFPAWLTKIVIRTAISHVRKNRRAIPVEEAGDYPDHERVPVENRLDLLEAVCRLPDPYKTVIILRFYKDFSIKQIADVPDWPEGTVKTDLHRALNRLKKEWMAKEDRASG